MSAPGRRARHAGFSLLELTTAIFILSLGVLGAITMFHYGLDKTRAVHESELAFRALANEIETLRVAPFNELEPGHDLPFRSSGPETDRLHLAEKTVAIAPVPGTPGLAEVTARIRWVGDNGRVIEKSLTTLIADKGRAGGP